MPTPPLLLLLGLILLGVVDDDSDARRRDTASGWDGGRPTLAAPGPGIVVAAPRGTGTRTRSRRPDLPIDSAPGEGAAAGPARLLAWPCALTFSGERPTTVVAVPLLLFLKGVLDTAAADPADPAVPAPAGGPREVTADRRRDALSKLPSGSVVPSRCRPGAWWRSFSASPPAAAA